VLLAENEMAEKWRSTHKGRVVAAAIVSPIGR
jgi:hypothetical protein